MRTRIRHWSLLRKDVAAGFVASVNRALSPSLSATLGAVRTFVAPPPDIVAFQVKRAVPTAPEAVIVSV